MFGRSISVFFAMIFTCATFAQDVAPTPAPEPQKSNRRPVEKTQFPAEPYDKADVKTMAGLCVTLDTEHGLIVMEMFPESAPESVRNFLNLAATGALDTTTFSRVVPNFVIQGGSLSTSEKKTPQLAHRSTRIIPDEPSRILHERGILSMARTDAPNTATTHFFILLSEARSLDGTFSAFGRVTAGMDVVTAINKAPNQTLDRERPEKPVRIKKASVGACAPATQ